MPNCSDPLCKDPDCPFGTQFPKPVISGHNPKRCAARKRRLIAKLKLANERLLSLQHALADAHRTHQKQLDLYEEMIRPVQNALRIEAEAHMRWRDSSHLMYENNVKLEQELREVKRDLDKTRKLLYELMEARKQRKPWWRR